MTIPVTIGVCACGHTQSDHPTPYLCALCSCGEYIEAARIRATVQPDPRVRQLIADAGEAQEVYTLDDLEAHAASLRRRN